MEEVNKLNTEKKDEVELSSVEEKCNIESIEELEICHSKHNENKCKYLIGEGALTAVYKAK